jgi:hypothetical protein
MATASVTGLRRRSTPKEEVTVTTPLPPIPGRFFFFLLGF